MAPQPHEIGCFLCDPAVLYMEPDAMLSNRLPHTHKEKSRVVDCSLGNYPGESIMRLTGNTRLYARSRTPNAG